MPYKSDLPNNSTPLEHAKRGKEIYKKLVNTKQVLDLIDNHIEYLETSDGDEHPSITIENLTGILNKYFKK